jgi:hypothetical protein
MSAALTSRPGGGSECGDLATQRSVVVIRLNIVVIRRSDLLVDRSDLIGVVPFRRTPGTKCGSSLHWNLTVLDADVDYQEIVSSQDNASSIRSSCGNCFHWTLLSENLSPENVSPENVSPENSQGLLVRGNLPDAPAGPLPR